MEVSREGRGEQGMRTARGEAQLGGAGTAMARGGQGQPSLLPAFFANPGLMAGAFMSDPFAFADVMSREMDRLFSSFGPGGYGQPSTGAQGSGLGVAPRGAGQALLRQGAGALAQWAPPVEVFQRGNQLVVRADLPGLKPDDVNVEVEDGVLTISGERRQAVENEEEGFYRSERRYGAFARSVPLPEDVDPSQVNATFENGELEVTVPLPQQQQRQRARRVQIQAPGAQRAQGAQSAGQQVHGSTQHPAGQSPSPSGQPAGQESQSPRK